MSVVRSVLTALLAAAALSWGLPAHARVRPSAIAGDWYPGDRALVNVELQQLLLDAASAPALSAKPEALVVPHAGWRYSGPVAAAAFRNLHRGDFTRVVVLGPSHHAAFEGFSITDAEAYETPLGSVPVCRDALDAIRDGKLVRTVPGAEDREHSVEIELPFLQKTLGAFCLVPIVAGETTAESQKAMAGKLASLHDGKTLFVFSSDFTHYGPRHGYTPFGVSGRAAKSEIRAQNERAVGLIVKKDAAGFRKFLDDTGDTICGRNGIGVLLELLPRISPKAEPVLLARYASLDIPRVEGDDSVTYVAIAFAEGKPPAGKPMERPPVHEACAPDSPPFEEAFERQLVRLARATIETQLLGTDAMDGALAALPRGRRDLDLLRGVFVTLNRTDPAAIERLGKLRGCVGQIFPVLPLRQAVAYAAVSAAIHDGRFPRVEPAELGKLEVELTLLSPPKAVASWKEIKLGTHGIVIEKSGRRAVFLPQVPGEEGWTIEETLTHLSRKAGLPADAWKDGAAFSVFTGQIFHERQEADRPGR
jgi:AmmeMemoRadiSam system protein B/AmmeMemoRadiSam system protein A